MIAVRSYTNLFTSSIVTPVFPTYSFNSLMSRFPTQSYPVIHTTTLHLYILTIQLYNLTYFLSFSLSSWFFLTPHKFPSISFLVRSFPSKPQQGLFVQFSLQIYYIHTTLISHYHRIRERLPLIFPPPNLLTATIFKLFFLIYLLYLQFLFLPPLIFSTFLLYIRHYTQIYKFTKNFQFPPAILTMQLGSSSILTTITLFWRNPYPICVVHTTLQQYFHHHTQHFLIFCNYNGIIIIHKLQQSSHLTSFIF